MAHMRSLVAVLVAFAGAAALSGCAGVAVDESSVIAGSRPPAGASDGGALSFGVYGLSSVKNLWTGQPLPRPELAESFANAGGFGSPQVLTGGGCQACDVVAIVKCSEDFGSGPATVTVVSARSKKTLFTAQKAGRVCERLGAELAREVGAAFRPGTALYAGVDGERGPKPAAEPAQAPSAGKAWWDKDGASPSTR